MIDIKTRKSKRLCKRLLVTSQIAIPLRVQVLQHGRATQDHVNSPTFLAAVAVAIAVGASLTWTSRKVTTRRNREPEHAKLKAPAIPSDKLGSNPVLLNDTKEEPKTQRLLCPTKEGRYKLRKELGFPSNRKAGLGRSSLLEHRKRQNELDFAKAAKRALRTYEIEDDDTRLAMSCPSNLSNETSKKRRGMEQKNEKPKTKNLISGKSKQAMLLVMCKREVKKYRMHG